MSGDELTEPERDQMAHAIGHHSAKGCSVHGARNYYATGSDNPLWLSLADRGLAIRHTAAGVFQVTGKGRDAIEADSRSHRKGRLFRVCVWGEITGSEYWAESHAKARYQYALSISDAWNITTREAFKCIRSCRLA